MTPLNLPLETTASMTHIPQPTLARSEQIRPGTRVEVRRRFDAKWASGFEIAETAHDTYRLRRCSDGEELPVLFSHEDVRREQGKTFRWT